VLRVLRVRFAPGAVGGDRGAAGAGVLAVPAGLVARGVGQPAAATGQRAGAVPYVLSQQLLLAGLARDAGDPGEARAVAGQVRRWARALGIGILEARAAELS
jgi:hypothetical protein